jgi:hypothetical protein
MIVDKEQKALIALDEMFVRVQDGLTDVTQHSIYYNKLRSLLHADIRMFCLEKRELNQDLETLRLNIGNVVSENELLTYSNELMDKYNNKNDNIGLIFHLEATRVDFALICVAIIKRDDIYTKKFTFRYRKPSINDGVYGLTLSNTFQ